MKKKNQKQREGAKMKETRRKGRMAGGILLAVVALWLILIWVRRTARDPDLETEPYASSVTEEKEADENGSAENIFKDVLLGKTPFFYVDGGELETLDVTDVPSLFDREDPYMKIWEFSVVDLDRDGEEEVVLLVVGASGDAGGKVILHQIDHKVYGYITVNRTLVDLKTDGTYEFSDPTGSAEAGIAAITNFSETGYVEDKISYATGTYEGWDAFVVDHQSASEDAYLDAAAQQEKKEDAEWHDFTAEEMDILWT